MFKSVDDACNTSISMCMTEHDKLNHNLIIYIYTLYIYIPILRPLPVLCWVQLPPSYFGVKRQASMAYVFSSLIYAPQGKPS